MSPTTPPSFSDQPSGSGAGSLNQTIQTIFSSYNNILLAAIISLLLVILFVLILHVYAKWFLAHARRRRRRNSISVTHILGPNRLHHFHYDTSHTTNDTDNGLDPSVVASIPLFMYSSGEQVSPECVICLSGYEEGDIGRKLRKCCHEFHVECIDMWLQSHSSCPICRAPVASIDEKINCGDDDDGEIVIVIDDRDHEQHEVNDSDSESVASAAASAACCSCSCASQSPAPAPEKRMVSCKNKSERRVHPS